MRHPALVFLACFLPLLGLLILLGGGFFSSEMESPLKGWLTRTPEISLTLGGKTRQAILGQELVDFSLPLYNEENKLAYELQGDRFFPLSPRRFLVKNLRLRCFPSREVALPLALSAGSAQLELEDQRLKAGFLSEEVWVGLGGATAPRLHFSTLHCYYDPEQGLTLWSPGRAVLTGRDLVAQGRGAWANLRQGRLLLPVLDFLRLENLSLSCWGREESLPLSLSTPGGAQLTRTPRGLKLTVGPVVRGESGNLSLGARELTLLVAPAAGYRQLRVEGEVWLQSPLASLQAGRLVAEEFSGVGRRLLLEGSPGGCFRLPEALAWGSLGTAPGSKLLELSTAAAITVSSRQVVSFLGTTRGRLSEADTGRRLLALRAGKLELRFGEKGKLRTVRAPASLEIEADNLSARLPAASYSLGRGRPGRWFMPQGGEITFHRQSFSVPAGGGGSSPPTSILRGLGGMVFTCGASPTLWFREGVALLSDWSRGTSRLTTNSLRLSWSEFLGTGALSGPPAPRPGPAPPVSPALPPTRAGNFLCPQGGELHFTLPSPETGAPETVLLRCQGELGMNGVNGRAWLHDRVTITRPGQSIAADRGEIFFAAAATGPDKEPLPQALELLRATGNVVVATPRYQVRAAEILYRPGTSELFVRGNPGHLRFQEKSGDSPWHLLAPELVLDLSRREISCPRGGFLAGTASPAAGNAPGAKAPSGAPAPSGPLRLRCQGELRFLGAESRLTLRREVRFRMGGLKFTADQAVLDFVASAPGPESGKTPAPASSPRNLPFPSPRAIRHLLAQDRVSVLFAGPPEREITGDRVSWRWQEQEGELSGLPTATLRETRDNRTLSTSARLIRFRMKEGKWRLKLEDPQEGILPLSP